MTEKYPDIPFCLKKQQQQKNTMIPAVDPGDISSFHLSQIDFLLLFDFAEVGGMIGIGIACIEPGWILCSMKYICHRDIHFCKATTHQRLLLDPSSVQCSMLLLLKATTLIFTLTYNKCASAPWGGWSRLQLLRQNKAGFSLKRPALRCVAEPLHCICSGTHTVDQIQSSQH